MLKFQRIGPKYMKYNKEMDSFLIPFLKCNCSNCSSNCEGVKCKG